MKMHEVVSCHACLRATRDWQVVTLTVAGAIEFTSKLCRGCTLDTCDTLRRDLHERRAAAVAR